MRQIKHFSSRKYIRIVCQILELCLLYLKKNLQEFSEDSYHYVSRVPGPRFTCRKQSQRAMPQIQPVIVSRLRETPSAQLTLNWLPVTCDGRRAA